MSDARSTAAHGALEELLEVSPQVEAAVIITRADRHLVAIAPSLMQGVAERFAAHAGKLLDAAEQARTELGREPVVQVEVATPDGHVFVTADASHVIAAITSADPTVGLVFYDLKSALRTLRGASGSTHNLVVPRSAETSEDAPAAESAAATSPTSEPTTVKAGRWRRRKS